MITAVLPVQASWTHPPSMLSSPVLLARTACTADNAACASFARLEPLLDSCIPLCALLVPPMVPFVHSPHASSLYSTRVLLARTDTCTIDDAACAVSERLGPLLDPGSLAGTNCLADATACTVSKRLGPLLDPGSLASTNCPGDATHCTVSERLGPLLDPGSLAGTHCPADATVFTASERLGPLLDLGSLAGTSCPAVATACVVMTRPKMFQAQQSCDS